MTTSTLIPTPAIRPAARPRFDTATLLTLVTTPAAWVGESGGFPVIAVPGQFVLKDVVLLGAALWSAGEAWRAVRAGTNTQNSTAG